MSDMLEPTAPAPLFPSRLCVVLCWIVRAGVLRRLTDGDNLSPRGGARVSRGNCRLVGIGR